MIKRAAFSLVEMLVAVILITLLIGIAIFSFKYQLIAINKTQKVGINKVLAYNQLRSSIQSMKYYVVDDYDNLNKPMKNLHVYFNGTKDEVNYITTSPLFSKDIALVKLLCLDNELIYQEEPLYGNMNFLRPELGIESRKETIYNNLSNCEFKYIVKNNSIENLSNHIPNAIEIKLESIVYNNEFYINIRSDYNQSVGRIYNVMYPIE